ncbi:general secretion pathway protein C [Sphingomonas sp. NFR04]|uniref:type II secretion system protein N n=1 Tax=Sphingomonas sp. NFR04 TaxID=1566283 RepID=UPI0008EC94C1|nr:type II secretion system protein N [Sphingomonas sp. NFR04]SFK17413.1 general secretion pathway protein C [Sphingomonas sp. NFR04]
MTRFAFTPRQTRTALDLLTGAMVVSVAVALAGLTWRIAGHAGTGAITVPSGRSGPAVAPDMAPAIALAPFGKTMVVDAPQPTQLPLELKGIVAAIPADLSTAFIAVSGAPATGFRVGQQIEGATIAAIQRDRVLFDNGGRREFLAFPDPSLSPEQRQAAAAAAPAGEAPPPGAGPGLPPPPELPGNSAAALQKLGATQTADGFRIGANGPPGMQPGDVITSVNGTQMTDTQAANAAFAAAQAAGSATIQILRDGRRITLTVPLR